MTEPKRCPICDGAAYNIELLEIGRQSVIARLVCAECDDGYLTHGPFSEPCETPKQAQDAAIEAWNTLVSLRDCLASAA